MKWITVLLLSFLLQIDALAVQKASRGELIKAFDGKFILIGGQSQKACSFCLKEFN